MLILCFFALAWAGTKYHKEIGEYINSYCKHFTEYTSFDTSDVSTATLNCLYTAHDAIVNPMASCTVNKGAKALSPARTDWSRCPGYQFLLPSHLHLGCQLYLFLSSISD